VEEYAGAGCAILYSRVNHEALPLEGALRVVWRCCRDGKGPAEAAREIIRERRLDGIADRVAALVEARAAFDQLTARGFAQAAEAAGHEWPPWYAEGNGFSNAAAMRAAHEPLIDLVLAALTDRAGAVLDLGCGNGALLARLYEAERTFVPHGVEIEAERLERVAALLPEFRSNFVCGDLFSDERPWTGRRYAAAILAPLRLMEASPDRGAWLKARLKEATDLVVLHAYYRDGPTLAERAQATGMPLIASQEFETVELGLALPAEF
jgi:SAM-dependent methyltransferase